jgi:hypothetical protein
MIYSIYPSLDSTIYEQYPERNTGIDPILELTKQTAGEQDENGDVFANTYNSRILLKLDLSDISQSLVNTTIPTSSRYFLNLKSSDADSLPLAYTLYAYPISQSWTNGTGNYGDVPQTTNGVSWTYRNGKDANIKWTTGSYAANTTGSWVSNAGGGTWYTNYVSSQSFNYQSPDVRMDITTLVNSWLNGSIVNNGLVIKRTESDESSSDMLGSLKFFGLDTHTIYVPKLEIAWNDTSFNTGSLQPLVDDNISLYIKNIRPEYAPGSRVKFRLNGRSAFPTKTYATSSAYLDVKYLPSSSYYSINDTVTNESIVPFDDIYTKISCDASGNYFNVWMDSFMPDRYYKIIFKIVRDSTTTEIFDNGFYFKVIQ